MHDIMLAKAEVNCRVLYVLCKFSVNQNYRYHVHCSCSTYIVWWQKYEPVVCTKISNDQVIVDSFLSTTLKDFSYTFWYSLSTTKKRINCVSKCAFIFEMWFFFKMCFHFWKLKGFVMLFFLFPKNTIVKKIVNKNLFSHYK